MRKMNVLLTVVFAATGMMAEAQGSADMSFETYTGNAVEGLQIPLSLREGMNGFSYAGFAAADGSDLRVTDKATGTLCPYEIESWNPAGTSVVWVKVPTFSKGTALHLTWGDASAETAAGSVWTDAIGIWHLAGDGTKDSSAWSVNFPTPANLSVTDGVIGEGRAFSTDAEKLSGATPTATQVGNISTQFTFSCWMKADSLSSANKYLFMLNHDGKQFAMLYGFVPQIMELFMAGTSTGSDLRIPSRMIVPDTGWHHYAWTYDGVTLKDYRDGELYNQTAITFSFISWTSGTDRFFIGGSDNANNNFDGSLDEMRFESVPRSAEWIRAACEIQPQYIGGYAIPFPEYDRTTPLTNFPALVVLNERMPGFSYDGIGANGAGILFTDSSGTPVPHEIEQWSKDANSYVWVNVPVLTNGAAVRLWRKNVPSHFTQDTVNTNLWPSSFLSVWHFQSTSDRFDSAGHSDFQAIYGNSWWAYPPAANGPSGRYNALRTTPIWAGLSVTYSNSAALDSNFTFSWWAKRDDFAAPRNSYFLQFYKGDQRAILTGYGNDPQNSFKLWPNVSSVIPIPDAGWHYYAFSADGSTLRGYRDGVEIFSQSGYAFGMTDINGWNLYLGGSNAIGADPYNGCTDELRLETEGRSADWIYACYRNQAAYRNGADYLNLPSFGSVTNIAAAGSGFLTFTAPLSCRLAADVTFFNGSSDGGTNAAAWAGSVSLGPQNNGLLSKTVSGLAADAKVCGRFMASNAYGVAWSPLITGRTSPGNVNYHMAITCAGYSGTETLKDFPLCVRLNGVSSLPANANKIRFVDASGAALPFEVEQWAPSGESIVWVRVPQLDASTVLTMEWGAALDSGEMWAASDMWDENYMRVWHGAGANDSGRFSVAGTGYVGGTGEVGPCFTFDGTENGGPVTTGTAPLLDLGDGCTFSFWARADADCAPSYLFEGFPATGGYQLGAIWWEGIEFYPENVSAKDIRGDGASSFLDTVRTCTHLNLPDESWHHYAYTFDGTRLGVYQDGTSQTNAAINLCFGSGQPGRVNQMFYIGRRHPGLDRYFKGGMDEFRVERACRSADWVKACYDNQRGGLCAVGSVSKRGSVISLR